MNFYLISNSYKSFYLFRKEIINELSKKYNIILIANEDSYLKYFNKKYECFYLKNLFNNKNIVKNLILVFKILSIFIRKKPHIVQTYTIHPNLLCIPIAKIFFSKTSAMITGMGATSVSKSLVLKRIIDFFYKISFLFCDHIIYVNEHDKKYFYNNLRINVKNINIFGAGVKKVKKISTKNILFYKYNLSSTFNIVFIGRLIQEKGILDAIKMFKLIRIPNKRLIIVGDLDSRGFSDSIDKKILKYPGIIFAGELLKTDSIYKFADIFILPSITEGMPTSLMEAIMNDVVTISYKIPGVDDLIKNKINGIKLKKYSINLAVHEIHKLYKSKIYRNFLIKNSEKLKFKIDRNIVVNKVLRVYEQL